MRTLPPARILVALGVTVVALGVLLVGALRDGADEGTGSRRDRGPATSTTSIAPAPSVDEVAGTSVVVAPDWYPKGTSRYSDRTPAVTITTLAPTTTVEDDDEDGGTVERGSG